MPDIRQIKDWHMPASIGTAYERLLGTIGTEEFGSTVRDCVNGATAGARRIYLFQAKDRENSTLQYFCCEPNLTALLPSYTEHYLALDPVWDAYRAATTERQMAMLRIRPSDIGSPGFRRQFFQDAGIVERVSLIQRGRDQWRIMNLARHESEGFFSERELDMLIALASLALPMLPNNNQANNVRHQLSVAQLEDRFASRFGSLTMRERQVCARAAIGMSVEATALDLSIAKTSVLTYRRRAYHRLSVTSPFELCSLVTH